MALPPPRARSTPHGLRRTGFRVAARGRRLAALSLAIVNLGIAVQAGFAQALFTAHRLDLATEPFFAPGLWVSSRLTLLAGTLLLSLLILRRAAR